MLLHVSSVLSVWVRSDLPSSGPRSRSVSLFLCLSVHSYLICLHKVYLSVPVCIAIAYSTHELCNPLLLIDCTHSPGPRGQVKDIIKNVFEQISNAPPIPIYSMTVLLSLFMSKWHNNYNSLMSQIFGIHAPVFFLYASLHIQDIRGILWNCRNSATPFSTFLQSGPLVSPVCFVEYHDAFQQEEVRLWHRAVWSVWWVAQCAWPTSPL